MVALCLCFRACRWHNLSRTEGSAVYGTEGQRFESSPPQPCRSTRQIRTTPPGALEATLLAAAYPPTKPFSFLGDSQQILLHFLNCRRIGVVGFALYLSGRSQ